MTRRCKCDCGIELPKISECTTPLEKLRFASRECQTKVGLANLKKIQANNKKKAAAKVKQKKKVIKQRNVKFKADYYANDRKTRQKGAKIACHNYIRERDKGLPCICCGRALGAKYDAGHFLESGNNSTLRYHEDNIHAQSVHCNQYRGGDSDDYEGKLRIKIGDDRVDYLLANKGGTPKRTADDFKAIEDYYKEKLKDLLASKAEPS